MNQKRTIIGAMDYSIAYLKGLKKTLLDFGNKKTTMSWGVAGLIASLNSFMLQTLDKIIRESLESGNANGKADLISFKIQFNDFIDRMIDDE